MRVNTHCRILTRERARSQHALHATVVRGFDSIVCRCGHGRAHGATKELLTLDERSKRGMKPERTAAQEPESETLKLYRNGFTRLTSSTHQRERTPYTCSCRRAKPLRMPRRTPRADHSGDALFLLEELVIGWSTSCPSSPQTSSAQPPWRPRRRQRRPRPPPPWLYRTGRRARLQFMQ